MDTPSLIASFSQQGFGYLLFILSVVIWFGREIYHARRMDAKEQQFVTMLERRAEEAMTREKAFEESQRKSLEVIREGNIKTEQIMQSAAVLVKGMDQLLFQREGNHGS
jgi:hypothetical protein